MTFVRMVQVTVVQVVGVAAVTHGGSVHSLGRADAHGRNGLGRSKSSWDSVLSGIKMRGRRGAAFAAMSNNLTVGKSGAGVAGRPLRMPAPRTVAANPFPAERGLVLS